MITKDQIMLLALQACPSFQSKWLQLVEQGDDELPYVCMGDFVSHLRELEANGDPAALERAALLVERLHVEGDAFVQEAATIGFLEAFIGPTGADFMVPLLGPQSQRWLNEVRAFWGGERRYIGEGFQIEMTPEEVAKVRDEIRAFNEQQRQRSHDIS